MKIKNTTGNNGHEFVELETKKSKFIAQANRFGEWIAYHFDKQSTHIKCLTIENIANDGTPLAHRYSKDYAINLAQEMANKES